MENFQGFRKNTFKLTFNSETCTTDVKKVQDELSKNHYEADQEVKTGLMPQLLNSEGRPHKLFPVRLYKNYIEHLNPNIFVLW